MNKFEQVSCDSHQMSLAGVGTRAGGGPASIGEGQAGAIVSPFPMSGGSPVRWGPMHHR